MADAFFYKQLGRGRGDWGLLGGLIGGGGAAGEGKGGKGMGGKREVRPPVEPLSLLAGGEFLHRPFDVAEVRLEVGGQLPVPWLAV